MPGTFLTCISKIPQSLSEIESQFYVTQKGSVKAEAEVVAL